MRKVLVSFGILAALILIVPASASAADVRGVTDTEVVVGITTPLSGPAALWGVTGLGAKAWADHINAQGGIHGRKIKVILKDDGYNPAKAMANLREMKNEVFAVCGLLGTAIVNASKDFFGENNIPLITAYGDVRIWTRVAPKSLKYAFITYPDYEDEAQYLTTWAIKNRDAKKVAVFYQNDDYGKMGLAGVKKALAITAGRAKLAAAVPYEVTERALSTHALKLKESGADTLVLYTTVTHAAIMTKTMAKVGYKPQVFASFPLADAIMYKVAGPTWEGTYVGIPGNVDLPGSDPAADRVSEILVKYNPKLQASTFLALFGAASMMQLAEGLQNAGPDLTPESMIAAMEKISDWKPENLGARISYGPNRRQGNNAIRLGQAKDGKVVGVGTWTIFQPHF
ncbi:MAG: ABC transporter substrate-binding protein [Deltaproteobacteria bacterium]|jgi:ABC-type branched-subunit amino acid transport system substrate-binding protein|nr:ABC transporter substrate-binding protein [Deltaproteobacteria bacterium]